MHVKHVGVANRLTRNDPSGVFKTWTLHVLFTNHISPSPTLKPLSSQPPNDNDDDDQDP